MAKKKAEPTTDEIRTKVLANRAAAAAVRAAPSMEKYAMAIGRRDRMKEVRAAQAKVNAERVAESRAYRAKIAAERAERAAELETEAAIVAEAG